MFANLNIWMLEEMGLQLAVSLWGPVQTTLALMGQGDRRDYNTLQKNLEGTFAKEWHQAEIF